MLLEVFVLDVYGGLSLISLVCPGIPAGLLGMLAGFVWSTLRRKARFGSLDWIAMTLLGIFMALLPNACLRLIPQ